MATQRPIAIYYEHPQWFRPLFEELDRRELPYERVDAAQHRFDPAEQRNGSRPALVFNRMSPSAWKRGRASAIFYTHDYLAHLDREGVDVFNGSVVYRFETSKALQVSLLAQLGLPVPRTRVVNHPSLLPEAAEGLVFPLIVKPNIGGSGAGIRRFDNYLSLVAASDDPDIGGSIDGTLLLQEYHAPRNRSIVRVETLEHRYLYGIRVHLGDDGGFDLCPADICGTTDGRALTSSACAVDAVKKGLRVEAYEPPRDVIEAVEKIAAATHLDVGGIEYLESERDGEIYFYDINALSNFVADPVAVVGFDPTAKLVDALARRADQCGAAAPGGAEDGRRGRRPHFGSLS
jgi:glutathione synthase/RimK-type ligase-like ATP-grasp enzyme